MVAVDIRLHHECAAETVMAVAADLVRETLADAEKMAEFLVGADEYAARALAQAIERRLATGTLDQLERIWDLSAAQASLLFGVSRQAYAKWRVLGVPADRRADVADIGAVTATLLAYVKVDRIPAVVRREADALGGESIMSVARRDPAAARVAVREMLDLRRVQP